VHQVTTINDHICRNTINARTLAALKLLNANMQTDWKLRKPN